jgi:hypothetical protein
VAAISAAFAFALLAWEWVTGGSGPARAAGYVAAVVLAGLGAALAARGWLGGGRLAGSRGERAVAGRLERLFPQSRGRVTAALDHGGEGLAAAAALDGREWLARRGAERLDRALGEEARARLARWRRAAAGLAALAVATALAEPAAAPRVLRAVLAPSTFWRGESAAWRVIPGDAEIDYGAEVVVRARYVGPDAEGPLVLEWQEAGSAWRSDTLGETAEGAWHWSGLTAGRRYRVRYGAVASRAYTVKVRPPLALLRVEARADEEPWAPLAGRTTALDEPLEIRGGATGELASAAVIDGRGREIPLAVAGASFQGPVRGLSPGEARVVASGRGGVRVEGPAFRVVARGGAFVDVLRPAEDPATLAAESAWLEIRAGAPAGLASLGWETADGRAGALGVAPGTRDTTVVAAVPLAAGRMPGDTVRYRVVARPASGGGAASPWRRAVVASAAALRAQADDQRASAARQVESALEAARRAAEEREAGRSSEGGSDLDRRIAEASDSLASALDRTLADPDIDPQLAAALDSYRQQLEGVADARFDPARGSAADPAAAAEARAAVLEAISERLAAIERTLLREAAADSLESLAGAQAALAEETRAAEERELGAIGQRQSQLSEAARETAAALSDAAREGLEDALREAAGELAAGDRSAAARAQEGAAEEMMQAAGQTRSEQGPSGGPSTSHRAALDRAGAESLFLAERQKELAERPGSLSDAGERAARLARQRVVTGGLDRALGTMVEAIGGRPAAMELAMRIAQAVYATRQAEEALARSSTGPTGSAVVRNAAEEAATALALLARGLFLSGGGAGGGVGAAGQAGESGPLSQRLQQMAAAQAAMADAMAGGQEPSGGSAEAAAAERASAGELREMGEALEEEGVDARSIDALARAIEEASTRLERGLSGARTESDLRTLARRLADLGRMIERQETERRRSETARGFVPATPPPLEARVTAPVLDPDAALRPWAGSLPAGVQDAARRYLERLAEEGVRAGGSEP